MTLEEARQLIWQAERVKLTVLTVYAKPDRTGDYLLIIEPVEGHKQIFADAMKAQIALAEWSGKDVRENLRYFAVGEDGIPMNAMPSAGKWIRPTEKE